MTTRSPDFDVLIVGGGHAGAEAAWAAARLGARTALVTFDPAAIGRMSCNPAIGGIGKGQMVREIDALGGLMGLVTDQTAIQFRMLNRRKGPAVWAPRAQCDREAYAAAVRRRLESCPNLEIIAGSVEQLCADSDTGGAADAGSQAVAHETFAAAAGFEGRAPEGATPPGAVTSAVTHRAAGPTRRITGVVLDDGRTLRASAVVITSGTFLRALMHCGETRTPGGRIGEAAAVGLSAALRALGLQLGRLKTGTPPRLARDSIDFDRLEPQHGDASPAAFSFLTERIEQQQVPCWITYTNEATHALIRANLHRAPMYSGQIESRGPRYCPSIEDKVVRFADKQRHQLFLEPEGRDSDRIYVNGISTSLPQDVQARIIAGIEGLERARVLQWGYAVEYDFAPPEQINAALMVRHVAGLFLAGQINGTSGYEEAAGQGLLAGVNAARYVRGLPPVILRRDQAYIGVMIDDLVTRGVTEPYRMFTSRAEHRMHLRYDNADQRLTPLGRELGLACESRWTRFAQRADRIAELLTLFGRLRVEGRTVGEWLKRPEEEDGARFAALLPELRSYLEQADVWGSALVQIKYAGYIERQDRMIQHARSLESQEIPADFDFAGVRQLRREALERWNAVRPRSVGQAARVSGVHPTDVTLLLLALRDAAPHAAQAS